MKKSTLLVMFSMLLTVSSLLAQTYAEQQGIIANYDLEALSRLESEYASAFTQEKQRALELAAAYGWEEIIEMPNGGRAELVGVYETGKPKYYITHNREGGITSRANKVHTGGGAGLDLNGQDMIVGEWDGGAIQLAHPLLDNRVTQVDNPPSYSDHSIHVAGTMIGTGDVIGGAAKGMAPEAELLAHDWSSDSSEMIAAAANGMLVSNHSYGNNIDNLDLWQLGYYDGSARGVDNIAYNAPYYLSVWSAGNDRQSGVNNGDGGYDYLTDRGVAKNNLVVAATNEVLNYTGPNSVNMSSFSSWGPTDDGRIKPDISAKGVAMYSSVGASNYANYNGTSMASPSVAGSVLLLQQHYNNLNGEFMLSSTLRGLTIHTADEAGTSPGPDYRFGWGLINVEKGAEVISNNGTTSVIIEEVLQNKEVYTFSVQSNGVDDLMASITWTDLPANILTGGSINHDNPEPRLINDLDIRVSKDGGSTYFPWKLDVANYAAPATTGDNLVDNVEKVEIAGAAGEYIIQVSHKGIALSNDVQAFSLIVTGINKEEFTASSHNGIKEACAVDGSATFDIDLGFSDGFSDTIDFSVSNLPSGTTGTLSPTSLSAEGTSVLTVDGIDSLPPGDYPITITAEGSSEAVNVYVTLRVLSTNVPDIGLTYPQDDAVDLPVVIEFEWESGDSSIDNYEFELSRHADFAVLSFWETTVLPHVLILGVTEGAEYFWRVKPNSICADGEFSEVHSFTVAGILGVNDFEIEGLVAYPNPTTNMLNIEAVSVISSVEVMNVLGQTLYSETTNRTATQIDLSAFQAGNYFVRVTVDNSTNVLQIIKQ